MLTQASPLLLFCPSDHHIPDMEAFASSVALGIESAQAGAIVTFGVHPSSPSTAYGYIHFENPSHAGLLKMAKLVKRQEDLNEQQGSTTQTTKPEFAPSLGFFSPDVTPCSMLWPCMHLTFWSIAKRPWRVLALKLCLVTQAPNWA